MSLKLPLAPAAYDGGDQAQTRGAIERADQQNRKRREDLVLAPGQRLVFHDEHGAEQHFTGAILGGLVRSDTASQGLSGAEQANARANIAAGSGAGTPGGSDGQLQFNSGGAFGGLTVGGDATVDVSTGALTIANAAVTLAKIQNAAAGAKLLGSGVSGSGSAYTEITLGSGLTMTGTTLSVTASASLTIGFVLNSGATGTSVAPRQVAPRAGSFTKCKVVTNASDGVTDFTFRIKQNGTDIFSADPTVSHGTAAGTLSTFSSLTSAPLSVAVDDIFSLDVTSGTTSWQTTIQLE